MDAADLRDMRGEYRRDLLRTVVYADIPARVLGRVAARHGSARTSIFAANYVAGVDFPEGATHFRDLSEPAKQTLAMHLNAAVHLAREKAVPAPSSGKGGGGGGSSSAAEKPNVTFDVIVVVETLPSEARPARCAGYRVFFLVTPLPVAPDPIALEAAQYEERISGLTPEEVRALGRAPPRPSVAVQRQQRKAEEARARALASPFAYGHAQSLEESRRIATFIENKRAAVEKGRRNLTQKARALLDVARMPTYSYARYVTAEDYHYGAVVKCLAVTAEDDPTATFLDVRNGERWGERAFHGPLPPGAVGGGAGGGGGGWDEAPAAVAPSFLADTIFNKERAMVYKMRGDTTYAVDARHCALSSYLPDVPPPAPAPRPADAMDIDDDDDAAVRPGWHTLGDLLTADGRPQYDDRLDGLTFPAPALTYVLNQKAVMAEILITLLPLPFAIGAPLPAEARWHDVDAGPALPELGVAREELYLRSVLELEKIERRAHDLPTLMDDGDNPVLRIGQTLVQNTEMHVETLADLDARAALHSTPRHRQVGDSDDDSDAEHAEAPRVLSPQLRAARDTQLDAVRHSLGLLTTLYRKCAYDEFNIDGHQQMPLESTHTTVGAVDFMRAARRPESESAAQRIAHIEQVMEQALAANNAAAVESGAPQLVITPEMRARIASGVDILPEWSVERNEFLDKRRTTQFMIGAMRERHDAETLGYCLAADANADADVDDAAAAALQARQRAEKRGFNARLWTAFHKTFMETTRASDAFLEARDYVTTNVLPNAAATEATMLRTAVPGRPYLAFRQWLVDSFISVEKASAQNMEYFERCYTAMTQAHRWKARRTEPAINYTVVGGTGVGKSYFLNRVSALMPVGVVQNMTTATTASFNVGKDFDNTAYVYEEYDSKLLFTNSGPQDTGATDKINYFKARTTSFCTMTQFYHQDEETGQRTAKFCFSSQHVVTLGATNQMLEGMDKNVGRRLALDYIQQRVADTDGGKATDLNSAGGGLAEASPVPQQTQRLHRELMSAFMFVETAIKAGHLPDVLCNGAETQLTAILKHANERRRIPIDKSTRKHWVMEAARGLTILYACYMGLFSRLAHYVYAKVPSITRWSPEMFDRIVAPFLFVSKDALIHALTMFDFFYCSRDEDRLLGTIAERVCHVSSPLLRHFRKLQTPERGVYDTDYNYVAITGADSAKIYNLVADAHKHIALPRAEDISAQLAPYAVLYKESPGIVGVVNATTGAFSGELRRAPPAAGYRKRAAIFMEPDPTAGAANKSAKQLCVAIEFLEDRFGFKIGATPEAAIAALLSGTGPTYAAGIFRGPAPGALLDAHARSAGWAAAEQMGVCTDARAPLVASIRAVLSHPLLERSPFEDDEMLPVPPEALRYMTFYTPDDANVSFDARAPPVRIPLHGAPMLLDLRRDADAPLLRRDNHDRPMPTAVVSIYNAQPDAQTVDGANMTRGYVNDTFDPDFTDAVLQNTRLAAHRLDVLEKRFVMACCEQVEARGFDNAALFAAMPDLRHMLDGTSVEPLPFAFGPITYVLERHLEGALRKTSEPVVTIPYPALNIYERVRDTVLRRFSQLDRSLSAYDSYEQKAGVTAGFFKKLAPVRAQTIALPTDTDDDEAPPRQGTKRARDAAAGDEEDENENEDRLGDPSRAKRPRLVAA